MRLSGESCGVVREAIEWKVDGKWEVGGFTGKVCRGLQRTDENFH